jgi:CheY-like chemotaxis protein
MNAQPIIEALRGEKIDFAPRDVADLVWLVLHMRLTPPGARDQGGIGTQATPLSGVKDTPPVEYADSEAPFQETTAPAHEGSASTSENVGAHLYEPSAGEDMTTPSGGVPLRTPAAQSLMGALELSRAMRPLMRRVPSRTRYQLDEEATVELIARTENRVWMPIMRPAPSRWLDVVLVVDSGESMRVWQQMATEVRHLLERQGAFRDVRTWRLDTDCEDGKVRLYGSSSKMERKTRELIDPTGQRLILVLTDCVSPAWKGSRLPQVLREWGGSNPVALVQVLPQSLWARTSLRRAKRLRVRASLPGTPNGLLRKEASSKWLTQRTPEGMPFPVLTLEYLHVKSWARLVVAAGGASSPAFVLADGEAIADKVNEAEGSEAKPTPEQTLSQFEATASPAAMELARLLSAAAPLALPVMRLVQSVMLPSSRQVHLAEVFNGGLLCRVSRKAETDDPERVQYDFLPGVREKLLKGTPVPDSVQVLKTVSAYLSERFGQSLDFPAILADPNSEQGRALARRNKHFAIVTGKVLSRMGGRYHELAERLMEGAGDGRVFEPLKPRIDPKARVSDGTTSGGVQPRKTVVGPGESTRKRTGKATTGARSRRATLKRTYALVLSGWLGVRGLPYPTNAQLFRDWLDDRGVPPENVQHLVAPLMRDLVNAFDNLINAPDAGLLYFYWSGPALGRSPNDCSLILSDGQGLEEHFSLRELLDSGPFRHFSRRIAFVEAYDRDYQAGEMLARTPLPFREAGSLSTRDEGEFVVFALERAFAQDWVAGGRFTPTLIEALSEQPKEQWPPEMFELTRKLQTGPQPLPQVSWSFKGSWARPTAPGGEVSTPPASEVRVAEADETASPNYLGDVSDYGRGRTILWVDDYPENNKDERKELEARGFRIIQSLSTKDALERRRKRTFDLVISDMGRGRQDRAGLDLLEALRSSGDATPYVIYASLRALNYKAEALQKGALDIITTPHELYALVRQAVAAARREATPVLPAEHVAVTPVRVFIAYKRATELDERVALDLYRHLSGLGHRVFIDQTMKIGTDWAALIAEEVRSADYLVPLLSASSVNSEMLIFEIEMAHRQYKEQGRPVLLPVRLDYREPFQYPLSAYLDLINWFLWKSPADTPRMLAEIERGITGQGPSEMEVASAPTAYVPTVDETTLDLQPVPSAQPRHLELPEGTMEPRSRFYIERRTDAVALAAIEQEGATIVIKGPRQLGKSSLLMHLIDRAGAMNKRAVFLDYQLFDRAMLKDMDMFLRRFCSLLSFELEIPDRTEEFWSAKLGSTQKCTRYLGHYILKEVPEPLCLAMDEVDTVFDTEFRADFFGMLRSWHNQRAFRRSLWGRLDLVLVTATEPYLRIQNLDQSPFNVGEVITLQDFNKGQVSELNMRYDHPLREREVLHLVELLHGHPYLTRRAFYLIATQRLSVEELLATAAEDRGPFGDHLRYYLFLMHDKRELVEGLARVLRGQEVADSAVYFRLHGAGLLRRGEGGRLVPRCQLYADYFSKHLL